MKKIIILLALTQAACVRKVYVPMPVCPYGPPYMLASDYATLSSPELISDMLADWILANGLYCEEVGNGL